MAKWLALDETPPLGTFIFSGSPSVAEVAGLAGSTSSSSTVNTPRRPGIRLSLLCAPLRRQTAPRWSASREWIRSRSVTPSIRRGRRYGAACFSAARRSSDRRGRALRAARPKGRLSGEPERRTGIAPPRLCQRHRESNQRFLLVGIIEDRLGIENLDAILAEKPGLDLVLLGRSDLAADLSHVGDIRHREVEAAVARYVAVTAPTAKGGMS